MTTPPGLDAVQERLRAAHRDRRASLLVLSAVGIEIQRMREEVASGCASEDALIREAAALLGAALSTPYRPLKECRDVRSSCAHPSFL